MLLDCSTGKMVYCKHCCNYRYGKCIGLEEPEITYRQIQPHFQDMCEAAEFESHVAEKLLIAPYHYQKAPCDYGESGLCTCDCEFLECTEARLKWARLAADEEINAPHYRKTGKTMR